MERSGFRRGMRWYEVAPAGAIVLLLIAGIALRARAVDPDEWKADDLAAIAVSAVVSALFLYLASVLGRRQSRLVEGVANSTLREKAGAIATDSLRTLTGPLDLCLHVGRDGLSAMPLFTQAGSEERIELVDSLAAGYSALVLNSFPRSRALPLGTIRRLEKDGAALVRSLQRDEPAMPASHAYSSDPGNFINSCLTIERTGREFLAGDERNQLDLPPPFLEDLYATELLVHHNWSARNMDETKHSVEFHRGLHALEGYFAPWYIHPDGGSEVDYTGAVRADSAVLDLSDVGAAPRWPVPLCHRDIRQIPGYRKWFIQKMLRHVEDATLEERPPRSFAILTYALPTGQRMVLDGNHRLAAALRCGGYDLRDAPLVYVFVVREGSEAPLSPMKERMGQTWYGFNPDVNRLREAVAQGLIAQEDT